MASVSKPVQKRAGKPLGAKDLCPFLEGQVGGHHEAVMHIGSVIKLKEEFGSVPGVGMMPLMRDISY